jgi:hypothetical protein
VSFTDFTKDEDLIIASRRVALEIIRQDPTLDQKKNSALRTRLQQRYERGMELFRVG